jgi:hypothetical protein
MDDSFEKEVKAIKAETPISVKADPVSLLYGIVFVVLGGLLLNLGSVGFGLLLIVVGGIGVLAGGATFVWKSPTVKVLQAVDSFLIALLFLGFMKQGGDGVFKNPVIALAIAAFMAWVGFSDLKEYRNLRKLAAERDSKQE